MARSITPATSVETLRKEAKRWLKALRAGVLEARMRLERALASSRDTPGLRDVQHALAREFGYESWTALTQAVAIRQYEQLARDYVSAIDGDEAALRRLNKQYRRSFSLDDLGAEIWSRVYAFRQRSSKVSKNYLQLEEAQIVVAQNAGFASWEALIDGVRTGAPPVPPYAIDSKENRIGPQRQLSAADWDALIAVMKERRITALSAHGLMTDAVLARIADLDHVTTLDLGGSQQITEDGWLQLARMPQLEHLNVSEYPGGRLSDRSLEFLRHLPKLKSFAMTWQRGVTDAGVANLRHCEQLERVDLMGSPTGDGAIEALQGKPRLRQFSSGRLVTDAGLRLLHDFPLFKNATEEGARLLIDGPFTNDGLASLSGLQGVVDLDLFWHVTGITSDGFAHLATLPNLASLGADGRLTDDVAMRHIGELPRLRKLRAQESVATDAGFEALARSLTLEGFWGRVCPNFGSRGFIAFSRMPALRSLGIGCANVDDAALSTLPQFPALRELTPIGFRDDGFRHIGRCAKLERLTCMYCRETGDLATEHIAQLQIRYYYAGLTQITDRSLEILGRMSSLEQIEFYECKGISDTGLVFLAALPRLREVACDSSPGVTFAGTQIFPPHVRVRYST